MSSSSSVVVMDNGGGLLKAGFGGDKDPTAVVPNCTGKSSSSKKWLVADQLQDDDTDVTGVSLRRPIDRGYLINPEIEREIWDRVLRSLLKIDPSRSSLLLVEPPFNPPSIQRAIDELVFEDFGFESLCVTDPPSLVHLYETSRNPTKGNCSLVVDCGFSFTHASPVVQNLTLNYGVKRMDLGGKALTNYLKELISYRSLNVMDETLLIDHAKEKLCFVSLDIRCDLQLARYSLTGLYCTVPFGTLRYSFLSFDFSSYSLSLSLSLCVCVYINCISRKSGRENPFKCSYVLPDGVTQMKGFVKDLDEAQRYVSLTYGALDNKQVNNETVVSGMDRAEERKRIDLTQNEFILTNERFLVPEMLFHPSDLGMNQAGLAECIVRAVNSCHPYLHPVLFESIILTGGSTLFPRFAERLERELRPLVPDNYRVKITTQQNPILGVWRGGSLLASSPDFESMCVTKSEYEEIGSARCRRRFFH